MIKNEDIWNSRLDWKELWTALIMMVCEKRIKSNYIWL